MFMLEFLGLKGGVSVDRVDAPLLDDAIIVCVACLLPLAQPVACWCEFCLLIMVVAASDKSKSRASSNRKRARSSMQNHTPSFARCSPSKRGSHED